VPLQNYPLHLSGATSKVFIAFDRLEGQLHGTLKRAFEETACR
jgi:hypothetical protein